MIVITGANGQLGRELCQLLGERCIGLSREQLDLSHPSSLGRAIESYGPEAIINCAAYTGVDAAEDDEEACFRVNSTAVKHLAEVADSLGCLLVQVSTDYVFAGEEFGAGPIAEDRAPTPRGVYANSKFRGEMYASECSRHLVIRTCGLYGVTPSRRNFVEAMLRLSKEREEISVVCDQFCNPTSTQVVAEGIMRLMGLGQSGVFNVVSSPGLSWSDFAREIFRQAGLATRVREITTEQYGARAPRPRYSVLATDKYERVSGGSLPSIAEGLACYLKARTRVGN